MQDIDFFYFILFFVLQDSVRSSGPKTENTAIMTQMVSKPFK